MDTDQLDSTLLSSAMSLAASEGWCAVTVLRAARHAGLQPGEVRERFPLKSSLLLQLGRLADESALVDDGSTGTPREMLFDLLMRRLDVFQQYRDGVRAVLRALPFDPALALLLGVATADSMRWIADAAGLDTTGLKGALRIKGVMAVWAFALREWEKDDSEDLGKTMAALDLALDRATRFGLFRAVAASSAETEPDESAEEIPAF